MSKLSFDPLNTFIRRWHRWIIIGWIIVVVISLIFIPRFFSSVSYNIVGGMVEPANSESQKTASILQEEFPGYGNESGSNILLVINNTNAYSDALKNSLLSLNETISIDNGIINFTGESTVYSVEYGLLASSLPSMVPQVVSLESSIASMNSGLHMLERNLSSLSAGLFQLKQGINQTSQLVYGIPATFVQVWEGIISGAQNASAANAEANILVLNMTHNFGNNLTSMGYYSLFFSNWTSITQTYTFQPLNMTTVFHCETLAISQAVSAFLSSGQVNATAAQMVTAVASDFNVTDWNQSEALKSLTVTTMALNVPSELISSLGVTPTSLVGQLYDFGPAPPEATLVNCTIALSESSAAKMLNASVSVPASQLSYLMYAAYYLGQSPSFSQIRNLSSLFVANATESVFSGSPLFSVNSTALTSLLYSLPKNATVAQINSAVKSVISTGSFRDYPYIPTESLTKNFVSSDNKSMLVVLDFSSQPDANTIARVKSDVQTSGLESLGTVYVTGGSVVTHDVENVFAPALTLTVIPGVLVSILIVGLLFFSPIAALIPVLMGGVATEVSLATIYLWSADIGHENITFLTPTITILLTLGLSVDYAVLQLRRTREERHQGKSVEESVSISVKWAGQAVLTAGITVIVAYIVMAFANVPIFSSVATSITLGVSILLVASLTLLPSLEIALGDKIFESGFTRRPRKSGQGKNRLRKIAQRVLNRKALIVVVISLVSLGAFYIEYSTPTGLDFLKLIPNFQSNQGLTVITSSFGSEIIAPTHVVVTTPTMIVHANNQFNQTLLNELEQISSAAASSDGVSSVVSPTRPFGSAFDYASISNMSEPLLLQYETGMLSLIGKDNKTALINVGLSNADESQAAISSLLQMEKNIVKLSLLNGVTVNYGGNTQSTYDTQSFIAGLLPEVVAILAAAVYVILFFQLRSVFTPLRLIFTILCSVVMSLAILSLVFYSLLNLPILDFAPLFVVVTMLGVGIDYDIFFVTRIREEALNGKSDDEAITTAIDKVWVTILGLGFVLSTVFASLLITGIAILQEISLAVSAAILIDVLVVIPFFVPSLMGLAQKLNWWPSRKFRPQQDEHNATSDDN
jgi:RND superfamily putative drug exporter